ncbi:DUF2200 family protein [Nocardioides antri]|nr:DUF2200 family protein [Nocardioides antri]
MTKVAKKGRTKAELDQVIHHVDKLVDELAKGKAMDKVLRAPAG